jgi:hypothetical protein
VKQQLRRDGSRTDSRLIAAVRLLRPREPRMVGSSTAHDVIRVLRLALGNHSALRVPRMRVAAFAAIKLIESGGSTR